MARFMLLLHMEHDPAPVTLSPAEMQAITQRYVAWSQKLGAAGKIAGGEKLTNDSGRVIRSKGGELVVSDGPYSESKDFLGGYFLLDVADWAEAEAIARTCPHAELGRPIEIRQIETING